MSQKERDRLVHLRLVHVGQISVAEGARRARVGRRHFRRLLRRFEAQGDAVVELSFRLTRAESTELTELAFAGAGSEIPCERPGESGRHEKNSVDFPGSGRQGA